MVYRIRISGPRPLSDIRDICTSANFSHPLKTTTGFDGFYLTQIAIGEGPRVSTFNMDFDTGSSDLWVLSTLLPGNQTSGHNLYNPTNSTSSVLLFGEIWSDAFDGTVEVSGVVFNDTINIGGITLHHQAIQAVSVAIDAIIANSRDGLVGLSLGNSSISPGPIPTIIDNLINNPSLSPVFTCSLARVNEPPGFYTFGYIDDKLGREGLRFTEIITKDANAPGQWEVRSDYAILNGKHIAREGNTAAVDTGTPGILLEDALVASIYEVLNGQFDSRSGGWRFPANTTNYPTLTLPAGSIDITLNPQDFASGPPDDSGFIFGSIQSRKTLRFDVFGHPWLNNIYAVFDLGLTGVNVQRFGVALRAFEKISNRTENGD